MKESAKSVYKRDAINYYDQPMRSSRYDPVKVRWEDKICQDHYRKMVNRLTEAGEKLRILDLGCGIGYGYHLISNILDDDVPIEEDCCKLLEADDIEYYVGLDINPELVDMAKDRYKDDKKVTTIKCDFLNDAYPEKPFNIFFSSGVPFSHFNDKDFSSLLEKIFDHIKSFGTSAFLVVDVLGRYSIEWQSQWDEPSWHIYNMSFFSDGKEKEQIYMKFWGKELNDFVLEAAKKACVKAECFDTFDRSIFIGRHIDTSNFNPNLKKMRAMVNGLFYPQQRAPLQEMFMDYTYEDGPEDVQEHYKRITYYWNYTLATACSYLDIPIPDWFKINVAYTIPASLKSSQEQLGRVVKDKERYKQTDDFRADVFEPLLGQLLRNIEHDYSEGLGAAHTLISIFEVIA
ncbi:MAG: class I SAM-dependent methyltransferase [Methanophagales archaeon]|nr:class I SAM-dependent methyltransferase [Methanophagales archaeon]